MKKKSTLNSNISYKINELNADFQKLNDLNEVKQTLNTIQSDQNQSKNIINDNNDEIDYLDPENLVSHKNIIKDFLKAKKYTTNPIDLLSPTTKGNSKIKKELSISEHMLNKNNHKTLDENNSNKRLCEDSDKKNSQLSTIRNKIPNETNFKLD